MKLHRSSPILILSSLLLTTGFLSTTSASAATTNSDPRLITISATGSVKVTPDTVRLSATVSILAATNKEASAQATTGANAVRAALLSNGIEKSYIKTTSLSVYPEYEYIQDKGSVLKGYRATQGFDIVIRNAANAGEVVDAVIAAGGDGLQINGVSPFVYDESASSEAARAVAVKKALAKAKSYAKHLSFTLGAIQSISEDSAPIAYPMYSVAAKADAMGTQIDLGQQDVSVSITVRWLIK